jgi:hypothetical protein
MAIISGCFQLGRSYQENVWAEELARTGHTVRVLAAGAGTAAPRAVDVGGHSYEVQEIATRRWPRTVLISRGADGAIREFGPDLILWIAARHHFAKEFLGAADLAGIPLVTTWSEHFGMHEYDWRTPGIPFSRRVRALGYWALRRRVIAAACRRSTLIVGNTPHARHIVTIPFRGAERQAIDAKTVNVPLGYDRKAFAFEPLLRERARGALGLVARFPDEGSLHPLVKGPPEAVFFRRDSSQDLQRGLKEAIAILDPHAGPDRLAFCRSLAEAGLWLGYDRVISRVLELLAQRRAAPGASG